MKYTLNPNISKVTVSGGIAEIKESAFFCAALRAPCPLKKLFLRAQRCCNSENAFYVLPIEEITCRQGDEYRGFQALSGEEYFNFLKRDISAIDVFCTTRLPKQLSLSAGKTLATNIPYQYL